MKKRMLSTALALALAGSLLALPAAAAEEAGTDSAQVVSTVQDQDTGSAGVDGQTQGEVPVQANGQTAGEATGQTSGEVTGQQEEDQDGGETPCEHDWETVEEPATCTQDGSRYRRCTLCGEQEQAETLEKLGHDYQSEVTREPTAQQEGERTYTCSRCGDVYTESIPMLEEEPQPSDNSSLTGNEPTGDCIDAFGRSYKRVVGGTYYAEQYVKNQFRPRIRSYNCPKNNGGQHVLKYHVENPTCEEGDSNYYRCELCGETELILDFPALGHEYTSKITRPATVEAEGERTYTCSRCGKSYTESIPRLAGTSEDAVTKDPSAKAAESNNLGASTYTYYHANPVKSYLYVRSDGNYTRVEAMNGKVAVEVYDKDFQLLTSDTVPMELSLFGGFFAGESCNFLIFGQTNPSESDSTEVIRVVKYSKDWERLGQASLRGANTTIPFDAGSLRCAEYSGMLYVQTCHEMYTGSGGLNHQANMTFSVRESDMTVTDSQYNVANTSVGYVSHSFNQFILVDAEGRLVTLNHGDAIPRGAILLRYALPAGEDKFVNFKTESNTVMKFISSSVNYNYTGAALGGLADSSSNYLTVMSIVGQGGNVEDHDVSNVVVTATSKSSFSGATTSQLTQYTDGGAQSAGTPALVKLSSDRFLVIWNILERNSYGNYQFSGKVGYAFVDGSGRLSGSVRTGEGGLSDCQPIYDSTDVVWYYTKNSAPVFCAINASTGAIRTTGAPAGTQNGEKDQANQNQNQTNQNQTNQNQNQTNQGQTGTQTSFQDVSPSYWGYTYITEAAKAGLVQGVGGSRFNPTGTLTMGEVVTLTARLYAARQGEEVPASTGAWYQGAYDYCVENGLFTSDEVPVLTMNRTASRYQMVELMDRAVPDSEKEAIHTVADGQVPDLRESAPYGDVVYLWYRAGIVEGDGAGRFNGSDSITRAEMAAILCRLDGLTPRA